MIDIRAGDAITWQIPPIVDGSGALVNADSLPTVSLIVNGTASGVAVTVTNVSTGRYRATTTAPTAGSAWAYGSVVQYVATVVVSSQPIIEVFDLGQVARPLGFRLG